ncbi:MAG: hypothetical protein JWN86_2004 [Planctomycetota bacterium]|nr:hypothetical protein [Planctomycetota bacterium]
MNRQRHLPQNGPGQEARDDQGESLRNGVRDPHEYRRERHSGQDLHEETGRGERLLAMLAVFSQEFPLS